MPPSDDERRQSSLTTAPRPAPAPPGGALLPPDPANQRRAVAALLLALLSLAGLLGLNDLQRGVYMVAYALLAGAIAMWMAVTSLVKARRDNTARPRGSVTAIVIAAIGILVSLVMLLAFVVLGKQLSTYGQCMNAASTPSAQQACQNQFTRSVDREITGLQTSGS
jgi:hypothetical protein